MTEQTEERSIGKRANELNATIRYTMWSVFRLARPLADDERPAAADEVQALFDELAGKDVVIRGTYDVSGLRADADLMIWWHASTAEALQEASFKLSEVLYQQAASAQAGGQPTGGNGASQDDEVIEDADYEVVDESEAKTS